MSEHSEPLFARPKVVCDFSDGYTPPFDVLRTVEKMLDSVPPEYLSGLGEIVLTNTAGLPRKLRRSVTKSRGRKVRQASARGLHHHEWNNRPAWIQIYVDNALRYWERGWWLNFKFIREPALGEVLFHEIGHHIHESVRPEFREREDVADVWKVRLERNYARQNFLVLRLLSKSLQFLFGPLISALQVKGLHWELRKGSISKAEFEERMKTYHRKIGSRLE